MSTEARAIVDLHDDAVRFVRDEDARLLQVSTTSKLRTSVVTALMQLESSPFAQGPFVFLDTAHSAKDPGWSLRAASLRSHYEARHERSAEDESVWRSLGPPPDSNGLACFAEELAGAVASAPSSLVWTIVLAPAFVQLTPQWLRALEMLLRGSSLGDVRWIVVDVGDMTSIHDGADGKCTRRTSCGSPTNQPAPASMTALASVNSNDPARGARPPGVSAPVRPGCLPDKEATSASERDALAGRVAAASIAFNKGDSTAAVGQQREARDLCVSAGRLDDAASMELLLAGYLLGAGADTQAELSARRAVQYATKATAHRERLPTAQLCLGSILLSRDDRPSALVAYSDAVVSANETGPTPLMSEACRLAGDTAMLLGMEPQAVALWARAVEAAERDPAAAAMGSAGHCARAIALRCEYRGLDSAAQRYWAAARSFDGPDLAKLERDSIGAGQSSAPTTSSTSPSSQDEETGAAPSQSEDTVVEPASAKPRSSSTLPLEPQTAPKPSTPTAPMDEITQADPQPVPEGTADVSLEDLAALHWQGLLPSIAPIAHDQPAPVVVHEWTPAQSASIVRATSTTASGGSTALLSKDEIFELHGDRALPPARQATAEATALVERAAMVASLRANDPEAGGTEWIPRSELTAVRARHLLGSAPEYGEPRVDAPEAAPAQPADGNPALQDPLVPSHPPEERTTVLTRERVLDRARRAAGRHEPDDH